MLDLTLPVGPRLPQFPGSPQPHMVRWAERVRDGYSMEVLAASTHAGTHIDAPSHFVAGGASVDRLPLSGLVDRPAVLVRARRGPGGAVGRADLESFEAARGRLRPGDAVVLRTGWQSHLRKRDFFTRNPGLTRGAALLLASRRPCMVCTDAPSIDRGGDGRYPAHRALLGRGIPVVENLANLGRLRCGSFRITVMPARLKGASGAPVRAAAECRQKVKNRTRAAPGRWARTSTPR